MEPDFMSDALDDLRDFYTLTPPRVFNVAPGFVPALTRMLALAGADAGFLLAVDLLLARIKLADTIAVPYVATDASARTTKSAAIKAGVVDAPKRLTRAQKMAIEDRAWGLQ
jgi:hypothetical protein